MAGLAPMLVPPPTPVPQREQSRARYPDEEGFVERAGVRVFWERYGDGEPAILLLPTWTIIHSRFWKMQIPYLARRTRVITFDGRGNGRSDRPRQSAAYADTEFVADALAVLDATGTRRAVVVGLSMGAAYALRLAADHGDRVLGAVFVGPAVSMGVTFPDREPHPFDEKLESDQGWAKYNEFAWRRDWLDFAEFFMGEVFSEAHSTKQIEDTVGWAAETDGETMITAETAPYLEVRDGERPLTGTEAVLALAARVSCPSLVIHGSGDRIIPFEAGRRFAEAIGARLAVIEGGGHCPVARDPVRVNLLLRDFIAALPRDVP